MKVPYMLVIGEKEMNEGLVVVRKHGEGDKGAVPLAAFVSEMQDLVAMQTSGKRPAGVA